MRAETRKNAIRIVFLRRVHDAVAALMSECERRLKRRSCEKGVYADGRSEWRTCAFVSLSTRASVAGSTTPGFSSRMTIPLSAA